MTAKVFFGKIKGVERNIATAAEKVALLKSMAERITSSLEGEVVSRSRNVHSFEDSIIKLSEAKDHLKQLNDTYSFMVDVISEKMSHLEDPEDEKLLTYHYLKHMSFAATSVKMHHARSWAYRRHDQAMERLDVILIDLSEEDIFPAENPEQIYAQAM